MAQSRIIHLALVLVVLAIVILCDVPRVLASENLIVNGGFETGDFKGWSADETCKVVPRSSYKPAHSGKYSARIGTRLKEGYLSQSITIPEKSKATFSFWYRIEKGSSLEVYLRKADKSVIQQWSFSTESEWIQESYVISPEYAGQTITIECVGKGWYEEVLVGYEPVYDANGNLIGYYEIYQPYYYYPYIDDVSAVPEIAVYGVIVKISGLPSSLSTSIFVDGREEHLGGEGSKTFQFTFGERHEFKARDYVYDGEEVRYVCKSNVQTTSSDATITFDYTPQYLLTVESAYGEAKGSSWFDKGDTARFSVSPTTVPMKGFLGLLGAKYVFKGWIGSLNTSSPSGEVKMGSPIKLTAAWEADYSNVYMILGGLGAAITGLSFFIVFRMRSSKEKREAETVVTGVKTREEETTLGRTALVSVCPRCNVENPAGSRFCRNCGVQLEYETEIYGESSETQPSED